MRSPLTAPPAVAGRSVGTVPAFRGRRQELWTTLTFLTVNGTIAVGGYLLLRLLVAEGLAPGASNAVQAVVTLQVNFMAGLLITWRWRTAGSRTRVWRRWLSFHTGRGAVLLVNLALFPLVAPVLGVSAAFVVLLVLCAVAHYVVDRWWVFRPTLTGAA